jgi:chorismate mutase-like protein
MIETNDLGALRAKIDLLDIEIVSLIANRITICRDVAQYKKKHNIPMMQPNRVNQVIEKCVQLGTQLNLSSTFIQNIYNEIIAEACKVEDELIKDD